MYYTLLVIHSAVRWLVLISLLFAIFRGYRGWKTNQSFSPFDNLVRHITATIAQIQLILGLILYTLSPIVAYFFDNFKEAIHERQIRFFGMEHITVMFVAIVLITLGSIKAKRQTTDQAKFKTMAIWYTIALLAILSSVPWQFSPLVSRPYFRSL